MVDAQSRETLPFGNVFINNTTIGTAADGDGNFELKNIAYGQFELVFSYVGYQQSVRKVIIDKAVVDLGLIYVNQLEQELEEVQVKGERDKEWERKLKEFEIAFLGDDELAESCTILNPWVIDFKEETGASLMATASAPIEISNSSLGYKITFYLRSFISNSKGYLIRGQVRFEEMLTGDGNQAFLWKANRQNAYLGSSRHLFKSILDRNIKGSGFYLYTGKPDVANSMVRSPYFNAELGQTVIPYDTNALVLPPPKESGRYLISMKGLVEIHFKGEKAIVRTYRDVAYPVSWIEVNGGNYIAVNREGNPFNPSDIFISGAMNSDRVAHMLPLNYQPAAFILKKKEPDKKIVSRLQEKVYLHTDKPYYYPGETVWLKGYMNYAEPSLRDSLSKVLYLELISPDRRIVLSKILQIRDGLSAGELVIADTLMPGNYFLRAYTNWMRNFGDENFYLKPLAILNLADKVTPSDQQTAKTTNEILAIKPDKELYNKREKILLTITVKDESGQPAASRLSISVTDVKQVAPIAAPGIVEDFPFKDTKSKLVFNPNYEVEEGIGFKGKFLNDAGKPEKAALTIIEWKSQEMILAESDKDGIFSLTGLQFYDQTEFSFHAKPSRILSEKSSFEYLKMDPKNKPYGSVEVKERSIPTLSFKGEAYPLALVKANSPQRSISNFNESGATILKELEVNERNLNSSNRRTLGGADYVISEKELNAKATNSLWLSLVGKVPGLVMTTDKDQQYVVRIVRASGLTTNAGTEPLVLIDNMPTSGTAGDVLRRIDASTVDRVEVSTGINVLYGSQGVNGIISIYTKDGAGNAAVNSKRSRPLQMIAIDGYAKANQFISPDYDQNNLQEKSDYRSTIYWNSNLTTAYESGEVSISFFAADLETTYRIVVEGVTEFDEPIRGEYFVKVDNH